VSGQRGTRPQEGGGAHARTLCEGELVRQGGAARGAPRGAGEDVG
jgi:hypothetical protein